MQLWYARDAFGTVNNLNGVCYDINACLLDQTGINWFDLYAACGFLHHFQEFQMMTRK